MTSSPPCPPLFVTHQNMSNTFSIEVSKALRAIGVEGETDFWFVKDQEGTNYFLYHKGEVSIWEGERQPISIHGMTMVLGGRILDKLPAYTLHDIFRKLEDIAEKVHGYNKVGWADFWTMHMSKLFRNGDYPKAEQYLMSIITKDHE